MGVEQSGAAVLIPLRRAFEEPSWYGPHRGGQARDVRPLRMCKYTPWRPICQSRLPRDFTSEAKFPAASCQSGGRAARCSGLHEAQECARNATGTRGHLRCLAKAQVPRSLSTKLVLDEEDIDCSQLEEPHHASRRCGMIPSVQYDVTQLRRRWLPAQKDHRAVLIAEFTVAGGHRGKMPRDQSVGRGVGRGVRR